MDPLPPRVVVLMSTFHGERHVAEQLRSILQQLPATGRVLVRDDGSNDATVACIEAFAEPRIEIVRGANIGFGASFLTLLTLAPDDADLILFADQDDVWLPGKIERAWQHLAPLAGSAALYGGAKRLVDANMRLLGTSPPWPRPPSFRNALVENIVTGCTAAINRPALALLKLAGPAHGVHFHDWWLYLVISAFGRVVFDDTPTVLYRQHGGNQIGQGAGTAQRYAGMLRFLLRRDWVGILTAQVAALMRHYGGLLGAEHRALVLRHFQLEGQHALPRWRLILGPARWRQHLAHEFALRALLLLHRWYLWPLPGRRLQHPAP
jgi:glycosyltransferase involved in cell wall biosynthesis